MRLFTSNSLEELVVALADRVAKPCSQGPMGPETIVVQGPGMERWLAMQLSQRLGVWGNPSFPFPRRLIARVFEAVLGPEPESARCFEPQAMTWKIAQRLPELIDRDEFAAIRGYLRDDESALRRVQLAGRIAETFDHYVIYRPEMIRAWDRGLEREGWQPILWRSLLASEAPVHVAARAEQFLLEVEAGEGAIEGLPSRIHLFGLTTLPPLYLDVLTALSKRVETNLFQLRCTRQPEAEGPDANPLWDSLGSVGREFQQLLADRVRPAGARELDRDPGSDSMLASLQRSLLEGEPSCRVAGDVSDDSIRVHACPGPMREVEVLRDQLTRLFEQDEGLEPADVLVMTPDIEAYAPFIEAAFGDARFPYQVADRGARSRHGAVDAFARVLDVLQGRLTATAVADLLTLEPVHRRFGIEATELDRLLEWIEAAGIRWGVDAVHRSEVGQPTSEQNTWRQGLDRMLLGLALPEIGAEPFAELLPAAGIDLGSVGLLGRFAEFCEVLFSLRDRVQGVRSVEAWSHELAQVLDAMVDPPDDAAESCASILASLSDLALRVKDAGFEDAVGLAAVRQELMKQLDRRRSTHRFLSGGVTFCEMLPMRSIPFRVIALLGMNDEAFPRRREPLGFDLMPASRRRGDRTARGDDRYLFLEALVSVREHLLVTYVGRSVRDGSEREPSVVIGELLDALGSACRDEIVCEHPLHSFSPRYFDTSESVLFSYSAADCDGARAMVAAVDGSRPEAGRGLYVPAPLPAIEPETSPIQQVEVARLGRFFEHPVSAFLQSRLGLYLRDEAPQLEDREPLELDGLAKWGLGDRLLGHSLAGVEPEQAKALLRAEGRLPLGTAGDLEVEKAQAETADLVDAVRGLQRGDALAPIALDLDVGDWRIVGALGDLWPRGRVSFQFSKLPHRRELSFWVHHLVLNCLEDGEVPRSSFFAARDGASGRVVVLELSPLPEAREYLEDLLALYSLGLTLPLPLLPRASREQADAGHRKGWSRDPVSAAMAAWSEDRVVPAERDDPYLRQAFGGVELLQPDCVLPGGEAFASLAQRVYGPYLQARKLRE